MNLATKCGCSFAMVHHLRVVFGVLFYGAMSLASPVLAENWSLNSTVSERFTYNDNIRQSSGRTSETYGARTSLLTDLGWQSPRVTANLKADFDLNRFVGPGGTSDLDTFGQFYKGSVQKRTSTLDVELSSSFRVQDTTFSEVEDTGILSQNKNNRLTLSVNGKTDYRVNRRLSFSLLSSISNVDFSVSSATLTPFLNVDVTGKMRRKLTNSSEAALSLGWSLFKADNLTNTTSYTYKANSSLTTKLSPRLTARALAGTSVIRTDRDASLGASASSSTAIGGLLELGLDYTLATMQFSFQATRGFEPSATGNIRQSDSVNAAVTKRINSRSNIAMNVSARRQASVSSGAGTGLKVFTFAPSYSYSLAREWRFDLGYTFRLQDSGGTQTSSNSVFLSLTRDLSLLQ